jgi:TolB-like protein
VPGRLAVTDHDSLFSRTFADLRRRRVFRVAAGYAVVAWLIIEVADVVLPALRLPEWTITAVVVTALAGFPIALLLGWLFDLTPQGIVRTAPAESGAQDIRRVARRGIDVIVIAVLLGVIGYLVYERDPFSDVGPERSIAVLPFEDISANGDNEYFSDGISEELLNSLVGIDGLRVAARTSSFAFKGRDEDVRSIAEKLNVRTVLSGSVRRDGDRVRITATLVDADDGFQLWSESYDRRLDNIFEIQAEIARAIVSELRPELIGEVPRMVTAASDAVDIRAYDLYLAGRHHWHQRTPESLERALGLFQRAVETDENFALAYTGLADTYLLMDGYGDLSREEATSRAETPVARALALDDGLSEAYASLGLLRLNQGDASAAELALRAAIDLNRNNSMAHMWLGLALMHRKGPQAALEEYERALKFDVLHPVINHNVAVTRAATGQFEAAVAGLKSLVEQAPEHGKAYVALAQINNEYGHYDEAVRWARLSIEQGGEGEYAYPALANALAGLGRFDQAEAAASEAERRLAAHGDILDLPGVQATIYLAQGRFGELEALANTPEQAKKPNRIVWRGVARVMQGDGAGGRAAFETVLSSPESEFANPDDRIAVLSAAAWAEEVEQQPAAAAEFVQQAEAVYRDALAKGWNTPQLHAWSAFAEYIGARPDTALARLRLAVETGWRETRLLGGLPVLQAMREEADFRELLDWVDQDLARMEQVVAGLEPGTAEDDVAVARR